MDLNSLATALEELLWPIEEVKQRQKRERILLAATGLFIRLGYRKTSIDDVARGAGVAKGTVYLYYTNKAEILYHALALEKQQHLQRLAPALSESLTPADQLRSFIALNVIMSRELPLTRSLVQGDHEMDLAMAELDHAVLKDINRRQAAFVSTLLAEALQGKGSSQDLTVRTQALLDLITSVISSKFLNALDMPMERYAWILADAIVDGIVNSSVRDVPEPLRSLSPVPSLK